MRTAPRLRAQVVAVAGLFLSYAAGVGASFRIQSRAHARLEARLDESTALQSRLPRLRDQLRRVDQATGQYLTTGQRSWLDRRDEAVEQVRALERELGDALSEADAKARLDAADSKMTAYLAATGPYASRRGAGRLLPADAARVARLGRGLEEAAAPLADLAAANAADLRARRAELEAAARSTFWLIVLAGAAAALFVAVFLTRSLTGPVLALRERARAWALGQAWDFSAPAASPEVADLSDSMREMAERLNAQYAREAELGRLKGSLVSMASHEFNNALGVLSGTVNLLKTTESARPTGRRAEYYEVVETNLRGLALAVSNLLDLGRLDDGRFAVRPRRAELRRVLEDAAKALKPLSDRKSLTVSLEFPPEVVPARADPEALLLVATNLLGNAIKYTPEGGRVTAGVSVDPDGRPRMFVADTGIGIAPEDRARVLEGHRTEEGRRAAKGFGVGLTLVKRVLDAHGASLDIDGAPGKGSRFSFALARWDGPSEADLFL